MAKPKPKNGELNANCIQSRSISILFYASDRDEPHHIHVERDEKVAKFWLDPNRLQNSGGFNRFELKQIHIIITENQEALMEAWNKYFSR